MMKKDAQVQLRIAEKDKRRHVREARKRGLSLTDLIAEALEEYYAKRGIRNGRKPRS